MTNRAVIFALTLPANNCQSYKLQRLERTGLVSCTALSEHCSVCEHATCSFTNWLSCCLRWETEVTLVRFQPAKINLLLISDIKWVLQVVFVTALVIYGGPILNPFWGATSLAAPLCMNSELLCFLACSFASFSAFHIQFFVWCHMCTRCCVWISPVGFIIPVLSQRPFKYCKTQSTWFYNNHILSMISGFLRDFFCYLWAVD